MRTSRQFAVLALFLGFTWVLAGGCSSASDANGVSGPSAGASSTGGSSTGGSTIVMPDASGIDSGIDDRLNPLCGVGTGAGTCSPDNASACRGYVPPEPAGAGGMAALGAGGIGGATGESSIDAARAGAPDSAGGVANAAGAGGAGAGGEAGNGGHTPPGLASYGCQVTRQNNQLSRQCTLAGRGDVNAPCFSAADCAPALACVLDGDAGRCLPYCCDKNSTCTSGTYCAERSLRKALADTSNAEPPHVPVCVPADDCSLEDQYPCPAGADCRCKGDTACMVVRDDGTTTCLKPGAGQAGDACPCAWNHICSSATNRCVKICRTDPSKADCGTQKCQASSELPKNYGVCVGGI